jgi:hypothetical protein
MPRKPHQSSRIGPEAADALSDLREGLERAHELVAEAKLTMRQLGEDRSPADPEGASAEPIAEVLRVPTTARR